MIDNLQGPVPIVRTAEDMIRAEKTVLQWHEQVTYSPGCFYV